MENRIFITEAELELWRKRRLQNRIICSIATLWMAYVIFSQAVESQRAIAEHKKKTSESEDSTDYDYNYDAKNKTFSLPSRFTTKYSNIELRELKEGFPSEPVCNNETEILIIIDSNPRRAQRRQQIRQGIKKYKVKRKIRGNASAEKWNHSETSQKMGEN